MRDFHEELEARVRRHHITDGVLVILAFVVMFFLFFWMATTI